MSKLTPKQFKKKLLSKNEYYKNRTMLVDWENYNGYNNTIYCHCLIHNYEWDAMPGNLLHNSGCKFCGYDKISKSNSHVIKGKNDIATTRPDLIKYFFYKEDPYRYSEHSTKKVKMICPNCGSTKNMIISNLSFHGFSCNKCSDGISYPEKFLMCILDQLNIDYITQYRFKNFNKYYDFYIKNKNMIIETHGLQHYEECALTKRTLSEEQKNDILKENFAKNNNIQNYIVLDCRKSSVEWIKKSVMESSLPNILNFVEKDIDWELCDKKSLNNYMLLACELRKNKKLSAKEISEILNLHKGTIIKYLKKGNKLKMCEYDGKYEKEKSDMVRSIKIVCINKNNNPIYVFNSINDSKKFKLVKNITCVCACLNGRQKTAYGYKWERLEDYLLKYPDFNWKEYLFK